MSEIETSPDSSAADDSFWSRDLDDMLGVTIEPSQRASDGSTSSGVTDQPSHRAARRTGSAPTNSGVTVDSSSAAPVPEKVIRVSRRRKRKPSRSANSPGVSIESNHATGRNSFASGVTIESNGGTAPSAAPGVTIENRSAPDQRSAGPGVIIEPTGRSIEKSPRRTNRRRTARTEPERTRRGRIRKWDRPPPPHDWRWYVGNLGRCLIAVGLLMFGFVGYQLWGTGIETARAQNQLENEFDELLAAGFADGDDPFATVEQSPEVDRPDLATETDTSGSEAGDAPAVEPDEPTLTAADSGTDNADPAAAPVPVEEQNIPLLENGDALAKIEIPKIGVDDIVVAGVDTGDLKKGPGHFADTPLPGQLGNSAIAGHRTTYGAPFHNVDKLEPGDEIRVTTLSGIYVYRVTGQQIVTPADYQVVATTDPTVANLTLTSCHPRWSATQRIVIFSELDRTESAAVGEPVLNYGRPEEPVADSGTNALPGEDLGEPQAADEPIDVADGTGSSADAPPPDLSISGDIANRDDTELLGTQDTNASIADAFSDGWFSDPGANSQVGLWGLTVAAIAIGAYLLSRRTRRDWIGGLVGLLPFVIALYFFFQNVNRLLPPNL